MTMADIRFDQEVPAAELIDAQVAGLEDWRGELLGRLRALIRVAVPEVTEEVKWRKAANPLGVPVWESNGIICTGEVYKDKVKLTFARGASRPTLPDCSTPASKARHDAPSTSIRAVASTRTPCRAWSVPQPT